MTHKSARIEAMIRHLEGSKWSPHYLGFFECFNSQLYYEAHDVLEDLWLKDRQSPDYSFYKGLIQLAGAFVHMQKNRLDPAARLLRLACTNLSKYPDIHHDLDLKNVQNLIRSYLQELEGGGYQVNPYSPSLAPKVRLGESGPSRS